MHLELILLLYGLILYVLSRPKVFQMSLNDPWFDHVRTGVKSYEGRRNFGKAREIQAGDTIVFSHFSNKSRPSFERTVVSRQDYVTFQEALIERTRIDGHLANVLPGVRGVNEGVQIYNRFVSPETQLRDGVVLLNLQ